MKKTLAKMMGVLAMLATASASTGCVWFMLDEPNTLQNMD